MTTDQIRDELAAKAGWVYEGGPVWQWRQYVNGERVNHLDAVSDDHPFPPTLDGAAAALPDGWFPWERRKGPHGLFWEAIHPQWRGGLNPHMCVRVPDHGRGHEMEDLYALALACVRAEEKR